MELTADAVNDFLAGHATETHIEALHPALKKRRAALDTIRVTSFKVGDQIVIGNIRPKYLEGLRGTLLMISPPSRTARQRTIIRLDAESTKRLGERQWIPDGETECEIDTIPLNACYPDRTGAVTATAP